MYQVHSEINEVRPDYSVGFTDMKAHTGRILNSGASTLLICRSGKAVLSLFLQTFVFKKGDIIHIYVDMLPRLLTVSDDFSCFYCLLGEEFSNEVFYGIPASYFEGQVQAPVFSPSAAQMPYLDMWVEQVMFLYSDQGNIHRREMMRNQLHNLLLMVHNELYKVGNNLPSPQLGRGYDLLFRFYTLLSAHGYEHHDVQFYADKLCITPYYLSTITAKYGLHSPKKLIDEFIVSEIENLLIHTDLPLKEIAQRMNFNDTSYMCRVFRKVTGKSLSEFRQLRVRHE